MKTPVGFKGRYFRLSAITALNDGLRQQRRATRITALRLLRKREEKEGEAEDPPPPEALDLYAVVTKSYARKACHCNCLFKRKFRRLWHLHKFFFTPPIPYTKTKTGTSPPLYF
ncbi:hypothetical protein [Nitratifractor sp.]|uniref:hypothetical protein n=1 Tax=Nitratifractor sp. TaxID=2268144 RepID=UPI0025CD2C1C|nr:hypothetical protein [Nitratifractor sp.]